MIETRFEWTVDPEEIAGRFKAFIRALDQEFQDAAADAGARLRSAAQRRAPVDTSRLQSSIEEVVRQVGTAVVRVIVGTNVEYAAAQEFGVDPFTHSQSSPMVFEAGGETVFTRSIDHPGIDPNPFLRPALDAELDWITDRFEQAINNAAREVSLA